MKQNEEKMRKKLRKRKKKMMIKNKQQKNKWIQENIHTLLKESQFITQK